MYNILVIEDDHDTRVFLREALEAAGYFVFSAANGADGLSILTRIKAPDLILLDWVMPLLSGEDFLRSKMSDADLARIPTVAMSTASDPVHVVSASEVVRKPISREDLLALIKRHCPFRNGGSAPG